MGKLAQIRDLRHNKKKSETVWSRSLREQIYILST